MERKNAWKKYTEEEKAAVFAYGDEYRQFISDCKTERECVTELKKRAIAAGFQDMEAVIAKGITLKAGDRVFADNKGKFCHVHHWSETDGGRYEYTLAHILIPRVWI